jgi:hypothetical protein
MSPRYNGKFVNKETDENHISGKVKIRLRLEPICCKLDELNNVIDKIENKNDFIEWFKMLPLEQLDEEISKMIDPNNNKIGPINLYYIARDKRKVKEND